LPTYSRNANQANTPQTPLAIANVKANPRQVFVATTQLTSSNNRAGINPQSEVISAASAKSDSEGGQPNDDTSPAMNAVNVATIAVIAAIPYLAFEEGISPRLPLLWLFLLLRLFLFGFDLFRFFLLGLDFLRFFLLRRRRRCLLDRQVNLGLR